MSLVRDIPVVINALAEIPLGTGSDMTLTSGSSGGQAGVRGSASSAGYAFTSAAETTMFGRIIDRLSFPLGALYRMAAPSAWIHSTRGDTGVCRKFSLGIKLQHGDSSGAGDMADYSTGSQPTSRTFGSSARTSEFQTWSTQDSTGEIYLPSPAAAYDLTAAKRYVRVAIPVLKYAFTTETTGDEAARLGAAVSFFAGDKLPERGVAGTNSSAFTSSTSTST